MESLRSKAQYMMIKKLSEYGNFLRYFFQKVSGKIFYSEKMEYAH